MIEIEVLPGHVHLWVGCNPRSDIHRLVKYIKMRKAYKYRLYPTRKQEKVLFWTLTRCRELYNAALSERRDSYKATGRGVTYLEQKRDLPAIKAELREEYQQIHSQVLQDVLLRLERAFKAFFRRLQNGKGLGTPASRVETAIRPSHIPKAGIHFLRNMSPSRRSARSSACFIVL